MQRNQKQYFLTDAISFSSSFFFFWKKNFILVDYWAQLLPVLFLYILFATLKPQCAVIIRWEWSLQLCISPLPPQGLGHGGGDPPEPPSPLEGQKAQVSDWELRWQTFAQRTLGPVANPKGSSERERKQCVEENKWRWRWCPKFAYCNSLFSFPSHVFYVTKRIIWFHGFSLYQWAGHTSKIKNSCSPVAYQFLRCCPPGLGQSAKVTWKLGLVQPPVHFIFVLFPFLFEFWVVPWKGGNYGEGLETAVLGHSLSGVYDPKYIFLYFQFNRLPWL